MTLRYFQQTLESILHETPFPDGSYWELKPLTNAELRDQKDWYEVLYRTTARFCCKKRHQWVSSWHMILFRFRFDERRGKGLIRMRRFGQQCAECKDQDLEFHWGECSPRQVWFAIQSLLYNIMRRYYENIVDQDTQYYVITVSDVPRQGRSHGKAAAHRQGLCEACHNDRCQEYMTKNSKS